MFLSLSPGSNHHEAFISIINYTKILLMIVESYFIESKEGIFFDVKGLYHPDDRIVAYARYFPEDIIPERFMKGKQRRKQLYSGMPYVKFYDLHQRYEIISHLYPDYLFKDPRCEETILMGVPRNRIKNVYDPLSFDYRYQTGKILVFREEIKSLTGYGIGMTGSTLIGLASHSSDIDAVFIGNNTDCGEFYRNLANSITDSEVIRRYSRKELIDLFNSRQQDIPLESTLMEELKKANQGKLVFEGENTDYYIRIVSTEYDQFHYHDYMSLGTRNFAGKVIDSSKGITTPSIYLVSLEPGSTLAKELKESLISIYSLRGRYAFNLRPGTRISGNGILEKMIHSSTNLPHYRLLIGGVKQGRLEILGW
ncbi:MAG: hypothetical protein ACTSRU_06900 [Candidatus Hodarchaeales archaeon]